MEWNGIQCFVLFCFFFLDYIICDLKKRYREINKKRKKKKLKGKEGWDKFIF